MYLITGAAWASGRVSDSVVELLRGKGEPVRVMVRRDDGRANRFRELGAVVADLTSPVDVVEAMRDVTRMFFNTHISFDYLQEVAIVCAAARELGGLEVIVNMSQMTVSQMTLTSSEESRQQRLFWLAEQIMNWSGVPVVHLRPTVLLDNPLFTVLARRSVCERDVLALLPVMADLDRGLLVQVRIEGHVVGHEQPRIRPLCQVSGGVGGGVVGAGLAMNQLDRIFITHLHVDHFSALPYLYMFGGWAGRWHKPLRVFGPSGRTPEFGTAHMVEGMKQMLAWHLDAFAVFPVGQGHDVEVTEFDFRDNGGVVYEENGVRVIHWQRSHAKGGASAYRLDWNGLSMVWTDDGRPSLLDAEYAAGVDVYITETQTELCAISSGVQGASDKLNRTATGVPYLEKRA